MTQASLGATSVSFTYDAFGERLKKTAGRRTGRGERR
jgi:hypothetical protein